MPLSIERVVALYRAIDIVPDTMVKEHLENIAGFLHYAEKEWEMTFSDEELKGLLYYFLYEES